MKDEYDFSNAERNPYTSRITPEDMGDLREAAMRMADEFGDEWGPVLNEIADRVQMLQDAYEYRVALTDKLRAANVRLAEQVSKAADKAYIAGRRDALVEWAEREEDVDGDVAGGDAVTG